MPHHPCNLHRGTSRIHDLQHGTLRKVLLSTMGRLFLDPLGDLRSHLPDSPCPEEQTLVDLGLPRRAGQVLERPSPGWLG